MKRSSVILYIVVSAITIMIMASCSNRASNSRLNGEIIEDISGLIKSFDTDATTIGAWGDYDKNTGRVLMLFNDPDIQLGYFNLSEAIN